MNEYFVYIYFYPDSNVAFYVGMGKKSRHLDHLKEALRDVNETTTCHKINTIRKILRDGKQPDIRKVEKNVSREDAIDLEMFLISVIGRRDLGTGTLTNRTMGGDGVRDWSDEDKKKVIVRNDLLNIRPPSRKGKANKRHVYGDNYIPAIVVATNEKIHASVTDVRWGTDELRGIRYGKVSGENNPAYGKIVAKVASSGEKIGLVSRDDHRWETGEIVALNKGTRLGPLSKLVCRIHDRREMTIQGFLKWAKGEKKKRGRCLNMSKLKWWNNGVRSARSESRPGDEWQAGRLTFKRRRKITEA